MSRHIHIPLWRRPVPVPTWLVVVALAAIALGGSGIAYAVATSSQVDCDAATSTPNPDGTVTIPLRCRVTAMPQPSESPTASPSPTDSPTPTPSPTSSPTATTGPSPTPSTTSPTPSPTTTTTGPQVGCLADFARCGYPNALTTGPTSTTTTLNGNQTFAAANTVIANTKINGCVEVRASGVVFRNVLINAAGCFWAFRNWGTNLVLEDVEITCGDQPGSNGFSNAGQNTGSATIRRADIHHCENGLNVPGNTTLVDSWIHDMYDGGDAHTDGAQFNQGAANIRFVHNVFDARGNTSSAVTMWDESNPQNANVIFDRNFFIDGAYSLRCGRYGTAVNVVVTNNRFTGWDYGYATDCASGGEVWSGNIDDNGLTLKAA